MRRRGRTVLASLLFVDVVESTAVAEELGDRRWRELLHRYHRVLSGAAREFDGKVVDTAGDGLFARFNSPAAGIRCAVVAAEGVRSLGIEIRSGVHIGEVEELDGKLSGLNVHAAARTMAAAGPGEIAVTSAVRDLTRGAGIGYEDRGVHELRGIEGEWHLFAVTSVDGAPLAPPAAADDARAQRDAIAPPTFARRRDVRRAALVGGIVVLALIAAAAVFSAVRTGGGKASGPIAGCLVTADSRLNDRSFNQAIFDGLTDAAQKWGINVRTMVPKHDFDETEWPRLVRDAAKEGCALVATVSSAMAAETNQAARAHPEQRYLTTDITETPELPNLAGIRFRVDQAAFQAGYIAAAKTKTGKVGTFGAIPIPTVTLFMKGFAAGVLHYNKLHGTDVKVLGWDSKHGKGTFVSEDIGFLGSFGDLDTAYLITDYMVDRGIDIVMPVQATTGIRAAGQVAKKRGNLRLIGVDIDQYFSEPASAPYILTSVRKRYNRMVYLAMGQVVEGRFHGGILEGTLANGGVDLAPYRPQLPRSLRAQLKLNADGIASGAISTDPRDYVGR